MDVTPIVLETEELAIWLGSTERYVELLRRYWMRRNWRELLQLFPHDWADFYAPSGRWRGITSLIVSERASRNVRGPRVARAHFELGMHYYCDQSMTPLLHQLGFDAQLEAVRELKEAAALDPFNVEIRYELASINTPVGLNRGDEAMRHALAGLAIPSDRRRSFNKPPDFYTARIDLLYHLRSTKTWTLKRMIERLQRIVASDRNNCDASRELARLSDPFLRRS